MFGNLYFMVSIVQGHRTDALISLKINCDLDVFFFRHSANSKNAEGHLISYMRR